ncbi:MAG: hypothetical protein ACREMA_12485, partial [Longimicrobiales bacterium]
AYDSYGRLVSTLDPDNKSRTWAYDQSQVTYTNARGYRTTRTVDHRGQTLRIVDGVGTPDETARRHAYGPFGTLSSSHTEDIDASRSTFTYDERSLLVARHDNERGTATYQYNAFGEPVFMRDANGRETTWTYDALGRPTCRVVAHNGTQRSRIDYTYDTLDARSKRGKLLRIVASDQLAGGQPYRIDYFYDSLSRLFKQEQHLPSGSSPGMVESFVVLYDYDALGRLARSCSCRSPTRRCSITRRTPRIRPYTIS